MALYLTSSFKYQFIRQSCLSLATILMVFMMYMSFTLLLNHLMVEQDNRFVPLLQSFASNIKPIFVGSSIIVVAMINRRFIGLLGVSTIAILWSYFPRYIHSDEAIEAYPQVQYPYLPELSMTRDDILLDMTHFRQLCREISSKEVTLLLQNLHVTATEYVNITHNSKEILFIGK